MSNAILSIKRQLDDDRRFRGHRDMVQVKTVDLLQLMDDCERMSSIERLALPHYHEHIERLAHPHYHEHIEQLVDAINAVFLNEGGETVKLVFAETITALIRDKRKSEISWQPHPPTPPTPPAPRNIGEDKRSKLMCDCKNCRYIRKHGGHMICLGEQK